MDKNQKGGGGRDKESPQQQLELAHTATEGPQPRNRQQHFYRNPFTGFATEGAGERLPTHSIPRCVRSVSERLALEAPSSLGPKG